MTGLLLCHKCDKPIEFDSYHVSKNGRKVPLDPTGQPHLCKVSSFIKCFACGVDITFSDKFLSKTGKKVPLEVSVVGGELEPHRCKYGDFLTKGIACRQCGGTYHLQ